MQKPFKLILILMLTAIGGSGRDVYAQASSVPTIDGMGPVGGRDHSPDEYLEVDSIVPRTALVAALLLAVGRDPEVARWRDRG